MEEMAASTSEGGEEGGTTTGGEADAEMDDGEEV